MQQLTDGRLALTGRIMVIHQRGMQVDGMRHDGGTQHGSGHQHRCGTLETWNQTGRHRLRIRRRYEQSRDEAERNHQQQCDDEFLEHAMRGTLLENQQNRGNHADNAPAGKQRQAEQQIEGDGTADHFGQIGGDGDDLGLHEEHEPTAVAHALAKDFRQALACDDAQLGGLVLDQYAHAVGDYEHPDQQIAISGAGSDVGGHVTRIHIGYGRHESRPENARQCVSVTFLAHGLSVPFPVTGD